MDGSGGHITSDLFFRWIPGVLEQLCSPIQKLVFEVTATGYLQLGAIPWASIDRIVDPETPQFRELIRVEVLVKHGVRWGGSPPSICKDLVCSEIVRRLPILTLCQGCWACLLFVLQRSSEGSERGVVDPDELTKEVLYEI